LLLPAAIERERFHSPTRSVTMTILVTGSTGIIGSQVVANLAALAATRPANRKRRDRDGFVG
jgi:FlaA1/EpsC-like NDP-sugar epimerase